jgi:hypothetical protein
MYRAINLFHEIESRVESNRSSDDEEAKAQDGRVTKVQQRRHKTPARENNVEKKKYKKKNETKRYKLKVHT